MTWGSNSEEGEPILKPGIRGLWSRLLYRLNIAEVDRMGVEHRNLVQAISEDQSRQDMLAFALLNEIIKVAYKIDHNLGNEIKRDWAGFIQRMMPADNSKSRMDH